MSLNKYNMVKILFRHALRTNNNISFSCGRVGLLYNSEKQDNYTQANFIHQIHSKLKGVDYSFMFKFDENNKNEENEGGLFIAGAESHIKNNKKYELYSIYTRTRNTMNKQEWRFKGEKMLLGKLNIDLDDVEFVIKIDTEGIEIPYYIYDIFKKDIFKDYYERNICGSEDIYNHYLITFCYSNNFTNNDIINFPNIKIIKNEIDLNLSFTGEELFYKKGNKYFFKLIGTYETQKPEIKLGRFFLRKCNVIFNADSKTMTFYKIIDNDKSQYQNTERHEVKKGYITFLSYTLISLIFLILGFFFGRKFCIMRRKRYANELEDNNYVYETNGKIDKSSQKLIDL